MPGSNSSAGLANSSDIKGSYVASVAVGANGIITATMKSSGVASGIASKTLALSPTTSTGAVNWKCKTGSSNGIESKYLPSSCR